jgi:hypothetical protein
MNDKHNITRNPDVQVITLLTHTILRKWGVEADKEWVNPALDYHSLDYTAKSLSSSFFLFLSFFSLNVHFFFEYESGTYLLKNGSTNNEENEKILLSQRA